MTKNYSVVNNHVIEWTCTTGITKLPVSVASIIASDMMASRATGTIGDIEWEIGMVRTDDIVDQAENDRYYA
jgi:hypothetical protein